MPTYEYRCAKCKEDFDVYQSFSEDPLTKHKGCGGKLTKVMSPAGIVLKGSGFYKTDSRSSSKSSSGSSKKSSDADSKSSGTESSSKSESSGSNSSGSGGSGSDSSGSSNSSSANKSSESKSA